MSTRRARFLLLPLMLAAVAASLSVAKARADIIVSPIDLCAIAPASVPPQISPSLHWVDSGDGSYLNSFCSRFVVDFHPSPGTPSKYITFSALEDHATEPFCDALTEYLTLYRWDALANRFTRIKTAVFKGSWGPVDPSFPGAYFCWLTQTAGDPAMSFGWTGWKVNRDAAVYRVAVKVTVPSFFGTFALPIKVISGLES